MTKREPKYDVHIKENRADIGLGSVVYDEVAVRPSYLLICEP